MLLALRILVGLVTLICFLGGMNLLLKGAQHFLPKETPTQAVVDNLFRFLSGIYFGFGFFALWAVINMDNIHNLVYIIGVIVTFSGLGRLYSVLKVGSAGKYFDNIMIVEILLGLAIIILEYFK